ncbi:MAG: protein translocase subunit SecF [Betaproteobacteria bacterium]|nr:protein translocase subunit SecF [Betaproteobacteria bacterium]
MEFFRIRKDIPFMRYAPVFNVISLIIFVLAVFFLATRGLNFSMEFTGGTLVEVRYEQAANTAAMRTALVDAGYTEFVVQNFGSPEDVLIRLPLKDMTEEDAAADQNMARQGEAVLAALTAQPDAATPELRRVEFVGAQVGREMAESGALALLVVVIGIMIYLAFRFEWRFGLAAILANMHDIIIVMGFFAFFQWEFSLPVLAAVLAVMGYSVNESVIIFDRVRETFKKTRGMETPQILNHAITRTISRTIITHGSTQFMVLSMLIFGGEALHYFALALTIGICFNVYSAVLVSSPIVMWLGVSREQFIKHPKPQDATRTADGACV